MWVKVKQFLWLVAFFLFTLYRINWPIVLRGVFDRSISRL